MPAWKKIFLTINVGTGRDIAEKEVLQSRIRSVRFPGEGRQRLGSIVSCDTIFRALSRSR